MSNEKIDRLFKEVAKELGNNGYCSYIAVEDVLRRKMLPLLEAGQAMRDCDPWGSIGDRLEAHDEWDAALGD